MSTIHRFALSVFAAPAVLGLTLLALPVAAQSPVRISLTIDGVPRTALVEPGRAATTTPSPLLFVFHWSTGTSSAAANLGFSQAWPEATIVYPQGPSRPNSVRGSNDTGWQLHPGEYEDQDVRFVDALLKEISATYKVDERQIFATGRSNGGMFCYVLLTLRPERFAAFAPRAAISLPCLKWGRGMPRPVLITHGTVDHISFSWAQWALNQLQRLNGCTPPTSPTAPDPCASAVPVILQAYNGGHFEWPSGTTEAIVRFFKEHPLSAPAVTPPSAGDQDTSPAFAGSGRAGFSGDGGEAARAGLLFPEGLALDSDGGLFIADTGNQRIRKIGPDGVIRTVAGRAASSAGQSPDMEGIAATRAYLLFPESVAVDREGNLFLADTLDRLVRQVTPAGVITTVAGRKPVDATIGFSGDGGPGVGAQLSFPTGLAIDRTGRLFIADSENHRVRMVDRDGMISTAAGTGVAGYSGDNGPAKEAGLNEPWGLAGDASGNLFIADASSHRVRKVAPDGTITTVAGTGTAGFSGDEGPATAAQINHPLGLAVDSAGNLFIVDQRNHRVRRVAADGTITTVFGGSQGGTTASPSYYPSGVAVDRSGSLLIADPFNHRIWKVPGLAAPGLIAGQPFPVPEPQ
jgi:poly(3-hydroxybutyrate) depolymerase/sugar lactone lactonase YvrE